MDYFELRNVNLEKGVVSPLSESVKKLLPADKRISILDIGCAQCSLLQSLRSQGYQNIKGVDISENAVNFAKSIGIDSEKIESIIDFASKSAVTYDFIFMTHVLEHLPKEQIIETLRLIKKKLLKESGTFYISVPNAMSNTGCYWAYEDFTHSLLFTPGSLKYVLQAGGFTSIKFIDPNSTENSKFVRKYLKIFFLFIYHKLSNVPEIYSFEIRAIAN